MTISAFWRAIAGLSLSLMLTAPALAETQSLVILHDNDIHGHQRSFCYIEIGRSPQEHCQVGGAARRATLIRRLRATAKSPVILIDAGDTSTRGPLTTEYEGLDEADVMSTLGYDLAVLGNNEFKLKDGADANDSAAAQRAMLKLIRRTRFAWVGANVTDAQGHLLEGVQPYVVRRIGGLRIAFLGLTTTKSQTYSQSKGLTFEDPVAAANLWIPRARAEADVVIAVTHLGVEDDSRLVSQTRGLDAVVGGHSHTFLYKPLAVKNLDGKVVPIVQDGEFGVNLGEFKLTFTGDAAAGWRLSAWADRLVPVNAAIKPDPTVAALIEHYAGPLDVAVGRVTAIGDTPEARLRLTAENLAEAWRGSAGAEVGLQSDATIYNSFRRRQVSRYDVRAIMPFHDSVWKGDVAGDKLKALIGATVPGLGIVRSSSKADDIDPAKTYSVAMMTYLARTLKLEGRDTGVDDRQAAEAWLGRAPDQPLK
jgi:2',3'-cyclic-nucleotide 2'-phosphodiesterase (5'-nucleotidase family)